MKIKSLTGFFSIVAQATVVVVLLTPCSYADTQAEIDAKADAIYKECKEKAVSNMAVCKKTSKKSGQCEYFYDEAKAKCKAESGHRSNTQKFLGLGKK
ncbi:MAG: hypothetical protein NTX76_03140 [Alphaproteobacteria bacterium]|nr:hypothetical protein [Alphaproteobacteria bacterium]